MKSYLKELESFEFFCQSEFQYLFAGMDQSILSAWDLVEQVQQRGLPINGHHSKMVSENVQFQSIEYSFFSGGKRFRPLLSFAAADYLGIEYSSVFPWAMALEMVHTYSLIHDDLPCMDNDGLRRGKPTNHVIYGDALALLSGDALLTEAFGVLAKHYSKPGTNVGHLVALLSHVAGLNGMLLGQYYDITLDSIAVENGHFLSHLNQIHLLKTGALIGGALAGPALIKGLSGLELKEFQDLGILMGYAFQVKDDILDCVQDQGSKKNLTYFYKDAPALKSFLDQIHLKIDEKIEMLDNKLPDSTRKTLCLTQFLAWNSERQK